MNRFLFRLTAITALALSTTSCAWLESLETDPTIDWSAEKLYTEARVALDDSNWKLAKEYYQKLEARYPFGSYAQQAQIETIYATWKDGDPAGAVLAADRFLQSYPNHEHSDYVLYIKALATLNESSGWFNELLPENMGQRDANASKEAFDILKELVLRFPDSRFANDARQRMHKLVLMQAQQELRTAQYYFRRHAYVAALERAQRVVREFQNTPMRDDALEMVRQCYRQLGMTDLERDTRKLIELNKGKEPTK